MKRADLYPLLFEPVYKNYLWGGSRISTTFNRKLPEGIYAESWEIADRDDGMSLIVNGALAGKTFRTALEADPLMIMGTHTAGSHFPLLIKLIDAKKKLSVQVHPDDDIVAQHGGEAKTEMWYLLGKNKTRVYCGFNPGITKDDFLQAVENGTCEEILRVIPVQHEDAVFVRGGSVHAIDSDCLILEIQQNSNTTYRIYDWGRTDSDGKPRALHIDKAVTAINWDNTENPLVEPELLVDTDHHRCTNVLKCDHFRLEKLELSAPLETSLNGTTFHALFVAEGEAAVSWNKKELVAPAGTSVLVPAALGGYTLSGKAVVLRTTRPKSASYLA